MEQIWFCKPYKIAAEMSEVGYLRAFWRRIELANRKIDPKAFCNTYWGTASGWEALVLGHGALAHIDAEHGLDNPKAVYPAWSYGDNWDILEQMANEPVGRNPQICGDQSIEASYRPVLGQDHVICITDTPDFVAGVGRSFARRLMEFQNDYPDLTVLIDGYSSYSVIFGMGFKAASYDPYSGAQKETVTLPTGKNVKKDSYPAHTKWINLLGMTIPSLSELGKRVRFNMRSALWAAENYDKDILFKTRAAGVLVDPSQPGQELAKTHNLPMAQPGDKLNCDTCSLQLSCKFYRQGSVCSMPDTQARNLAKMFGTRDADVIVDALGELVGLQATRVQRGMVQEEILGDLDPEVSKQLNATIDNGIKLAKLIDPSRAGGTKVQVNVGQGAASQVQMGSAGPIVSQIVREIQNRTGLPASEITADMVATQMQLMANGQQVVQGEIAQ